MRFLQMGRYYGLPTISEMKAWRRRFCTPADEELRYGLSWRENPRTGAVNSNVQKLLAAEDALGKDLRILSHQMIDNRFLRKCRLHEKLYYFSHPVPSALVGTFNPSGNMPEDPAVIRKIGDQDRGHNVLVEILEPVLDHGASQACAAHVSNDSRSVGTFHAGK